MGGGLCARHCSRAEGALLLGVQHPRTLAVLGRDGAAADAVVAEARRAAKDGWMAVEEGREGATQQRKAEARRRGCRETAAEWLTKEAAAAPTHRGWELSATA